MKSCVVSVAWHRLRGDPCGAPALAWGAREAAWGAGRPALALPAQVQGGGGGGLTSSVSFLYLFPILSSFPSLLRCRLFGGRTGLLSLSGLETLGFLSLRRKVTFYPTFPCRADEQAKLYQAPPSPFLNQKVDCTQKPSAFNLQVKYRMKRLGNTLFRGKTLERQRGGRFPCLGLLRMASLWRWLVSQTMNPFSLGTCWATHPSQSPSIC